MVIFTVITSVAFLFMLVRNINSSIEMKAYKKGEHGEVLYVMEETRTGMKVLRIVCLLLILVVAGLFILDISKFETMRDVDALLPASLILGLLIFVVAPFSAIEMADGGEPPMILKELGIVSPLEEVGFTKKEIRMALKAMNIPSWNKPSSACLASRIPYGERLTAEKMRVVYELENFITSLGFPQVRVRHHGKIAIVEVRPEDRERFAQDIILDVVNERIKKAGFLYATMDLAGYATGKLNDEL